MVPSPLVARSNAPTEIAARGGEIVAVCDVLSWVDFTCQESAVGLDTVGVCESNWPRLAEAFGPTERGHFASTIVRRYPTDSPVNSGGYSMAMTAL